MRAVGASVVAMAIGSSVALAQGTPPDYGLTWRTVGDPGNPALQPSPQYPLLDAPVGAVGYSYRLTQTEVTNTQWIEFVNVYSRFHPQTSVINDLGFSGRDVYRSSNDPNNFGWHPGPDAENAAAVVSWLYAARYVNWLCNGKVDQPWAFENGAYDMSTFHQQPNGTWVGQTTRAPGAPFWIPDNDEWVKGMYWDPNKLGPGIGGYWRYEDSSDTLPVGGPPGTPGVQTSASSYAWPYRYVPAGSYPDAQSPWGLLDGSGGASEHMDTWVQNAGFRGSQTREQLYETTDRVDATIFAAPPWAPTAGLRIASTVPTPGTGVLLLASLVAVLRRRR
jgi:uncharacterized protein (TIGR03382 family)